MEFIRGYCKTNLDDYTMTVEKFCGVPNIGDRVSCLKKGVSTSLRVCQITHCYDCARYEPYIIVELHN